MRIGDLLRAWRILEKMTLRGMADEIGLPLETYRRVERGDELRGRTLAKVLRWLLED
ncbi:MAG: helix-turn-helix domain-containing protein [Terracidiphilus sp.]|nr:helix-turn-helix domain-containing protein [Terracidiphilus sp.]MDR3799927.1 helix-turn-helix domain-containing protein [Terracidiphilus sp.]